MNNKVLEYKILSNLSFVDLEKTVNGYIDNGWQPTGGICIRPSFKNGKWTWGSLFCQAIIKYSDNGQ